MLHTILLRESRDIFHLSLLTGDDMNQQEEALSQQEIKTFIEDIFAGIEHDTGRKVETDLRIVIVERYEKRQGGSIMDEYDLSLFEEFSRGWFDRHCYAVTDNELLPLSVQRKPRGQYARGIAFKRRLQRFAFIADRIQLRVWNWRCDNLHIGREISWITLAEEWNRLHPGHRMTSENLRRDYYRNRADASLRATYYEEVVDRDDFLKILHRMGVFQVQSTEVTEVIGRVMDDKLLPRMIDNRDGERNHHRPNAAV